MSTPTLATALKPPVGVGTRPKMLPGVTNSADLTEALLDDLSNLEYRPYDFVMWAFPWGEPGTDLERYDGPEDWQRQVLLEAQIELLAKKAQADLFTLAYNIAIKSGKNVGKSALLSWLIWWAFSTRRGTKGRATANTKTQIQSILWAELAKWHRLFIAKQFFNVTATRMQSTDPKYKDWMFEAVPWSKDNPDAWAGLHNQGGRIIQIFDEAAEIDDSIWERADGATREANTEVFWVVASNPTRNFGRFYDCFHKLKDLWHTYTVDSRSVRLTDHAAIQAAIELWGEDDDYTRVQFLGEFPYTSFHQLIPTETIALARTRLNSAPPPSEPLILGVDVARYGDNESVCQFRRGRDARSFPVMRRRGLSTIEVGNWVIGLMTTYSPDAVFIDEGGIGGGPIDHIRSLGHDVFGVLFGGKPAGLTQGIRVADKRAEMFVQLRDWLRSGGCITDDQTLHDQLADLDYHIKKDALRLMSKEDMRSIGRTSPDWADALALTFAMPVQRKGSNFGLPSRANMEYNPMSLDNLPDREKTPGRSRYEYT
jgi:hypothetical protein